MKEPDYSFKDLIRKRLLSSSSACKFCLSYINFEKIDKNLQINRKERKNEKNIGIIDNQKIILDLRREVRKELYHLINGPKNQIILNGNDESDNGNILGKKREFDIPIIDITDIE